MIDDEKKAAGKMGMSVPVYRVWLSEVAYATRGIDNPANNNFGAFKRAELKQIISDESVKKSFADQMKAKVATNKRRLGSEIYLSAIWLYEHK